MLDPVAQSALVVLVAYLLNLLCKAVGIPLSTEVLSAVAAAIVAWLLALPLGAFMAQGIRSLF